MAFTTLKIAMATPPMLGLPDFSMTFVVKCDALEVDLGAMLMQRGPLASPSQALKGMNLFSANL